MAFIDVVRWNGSPDVFAWRFPESNLTTLTQLVVNESQEAVLFDKGTLLRKFSSGKHTLSTANIPLLENLYGIPFGGENPFTAEVWFVNKAASLDVKWGTQQPFMVRDPEFGVVVPVRGFGQFGVRIGEAEKFLVQLVGTLPVFDKQRLTDYFRGLLMSRATAVIAQTLVDRKCSVLDVAARITDLSDALRESLAGEFARYGIELLNFYISQISVPEDDPVVAALRQSLSKRAEMNILGYTYQQERSYDVLDHAAKNEGAGSGIMNAGLGLGMGLGAGGAVGQLMHMVTRQVSEDRQPMSKCPSCGAQMAAEARFCPLCGKPNRQRQNPVCDKCGCAIPVGAKFCPGCGDAYNPCPSCGADLPADAAACPACGAQAPAVCGECGMNVPAGAKFCPGCGRPAREVCPQCGYEAGAGQAFCAKCGTKLGK